MESFARNDKLIGMNTSSTKLPPAEKMYDAFLRRDSGFDGVFFVAVKTTGIFCRTTCSARRPKFENVEFYSSTSDCLSAGYRACKRCKPLEVAGGMPEWLKTLLDTLEQDPTRRWMNNDIANLGVEPSRAERWFEANHGMTFQKFLRIRRLTNALHQLSIGESIDKVAHDAGYESLSGFRDAFQKAFGITPGGAVQAKRPMLVNRIPTPLGPMVIIASDNELLLLEFADRQLLETQIQTLAKRLDVGFCPGETPIMQETQRQLSQYFASARQQFDLPIGIYGSDFQQSVWQALLQIPYGTTKSYEQMAQALGKPLASRAIGRANGTNRLAIVIPCHRVIRQNGELSGYSGNAWRKQWLLKLEQSAGGLRRLADDSIV